MLLARDAVIRAEGWVEVWRLPPDLSGRDSSDWLWRGEQIWRGPNALVYSGVDAMARLLAGRSGGLDGLYLEYANTGDPGLVTPPAVDPLVGVEYYTGLAAPRDYLRVPARLDGGPDPVDSRYRGNRLRLVGTSAGARGVNGLDFSGAAGSVIYGAALALLGPAPADDLVYARTYFGDFDVLAANKQVGVSWVLTLRHPEDA
jgi:hypothetical protein